jgi:hypothetical protein
MIFSLFSSCLLYSSAVVNRCLPTWLSSEMTLYVSAADENGVGVRPTSGLNLFTREAGCQHAAIFPS